jgi:hypothetical protein
MVYGYYVRSRPLIYSWKNWHGYQNTPTQRTLSILACHDNLLAKQHGLLDCLVIDPVCDSRLLHDLVSVVMIWEAGGRELRT